MSLQLALEAFGWLGSTIVVCSLLLGDQLKFRWYNLLGSVIAATYCALVNTWPPVLMNGVIVLIDAYWILRLRRLRRKQAELVQRERQAPAE